MYASWCLVREHAEKYLTWWQLRSLICEDILVWYLRTLLICRHVRRNSIWIKIVCHSKCLISLFLDLVLKDHRTLCFSTTPSTKNLQQPVLWTITHPLPGHVSAGGRGGVWAPNLPANPIIYCPPLHPRSQLAIVAPAAVMEGCP